MISTTLETYDSLLSHLIQASSFLKRAKSGAPLSASFQIALSKLEAGEIVDTILSHIPHQAREVLGRPGATVDDLPALFR